MKTTTTLKVGDLMSRNVVSIGPDTDLTVAIRIMDRESMSALPVVTESGVVCGILSVSDLIELTYSLQFDVSVLSYVSDVVRKTLTDAIAEDNSEATVADVMTCTVQSVTPNSNIVEAAKILIDNEIHHLPVIDLQGKAVGILSTTDIVRSVAYC